MYYVYILKSRQTGKLYKGSTEDISQRLQEHNNGENTSTRAGRPWHLVYYEAFTSKRDAIREERFLKSGRGRDRIKYLLQDI